MRCCHQEQQLLLYSQCLLHLLDTGCAAETFANATQTLAGFFEMCTSRLNYTHLVDSTIPYHQSNIARGEPPAACSACSVLFKISCNSMHAQPLLGIGYWLYMVHVRNST